MANFPYYSPYSYQPNYYNTQPYMPQPQQTQPAQQMQTQNPSTIMWVSNAQQAAMYPVAPNNAVALWDSGAPVIYLKQADASGKPTMKTYDLVERAEKLTEPLQTQEGSNTTYATKSELEALDSVIAALREDLNKLKAKANAKHTAKGEDNDG